MGIGERIKKARKIRGFSQGKLAELCGWTTDDGEANQSRISHYENEHRALSVADLETIANALDFDVASFFKNGEFIDKQHDNEHEIFLAIAEWMAANKIFLTREQIIRFCAALSELSDYGQLSPDFLNSVAKALGFKI